MTGDIAKEQGARMSKIYDRERIGIKLRGGIFHFTLDHSAEEKGIYLCDEIGETETFSDGSQERLLVFQLQRLWGHDCAISLAFAFVWRVLDSKDLSLKVELRDSVSTLPITGDFDATFITSCAFSNETDRKELISSYFQGKDVKGEILDEHKVLPIMMNAARIVNSLPKDVVQAAHSNFMSEYNQILHPPYCESDMSSVPTIPQMTQSPSANQYVWPEPYMAPPPQLMHMAAQQQAPMMNFNAQEVMSSPQNMMKALQAMMQVMSGNQASQFPQHPQQQQMYSPHNQLMMNGFQQPHQGFNMNMPSTMTPGMNYPFFMPQEKPKPEYSYVDVPCGALPYRFYSKIFRHIAHSYIDRLVYQKEYHHEKYLWVATEKVKGFSMSLITDGTHVSVGTRSEILNTKEHYDKFPQWYDVFQPYFAKLLETFKYCSENHFPGLRSLQVFVELFGGDYPHADVENTPYTKPIVREDPVFYSPDYHIYAFDIYINGDFIPFNQTLDIFQSCGWLHAKVLAAGTFQEIMEFDVDNLKSFIPGHLNLPEIEGNIAEGIVLRMLHHTRRFKKKRDIHGLTSPEPRKIEYFTPEQERLLEIGRNFFTVSRLFENLKNQSPEHVELWAKTYPSRLVGRLLADGCKRFRSEYAEAISQAWIKKKVPFGRYFKPHVQKVVEAYIKAFQDGSDSSAFESSTETGDSSSQ